MKLYKSKTITLKTLAACLICSCHPFFPHEESKVKSYCFDLNSHCLVYKEDTSLWDSCIESHGIENFNPPEFIQLIHAPFDHTLKAPKTSYLINLFTHSIFYTHETDLGIFNSIPKVDVLIAPNNIEPIDFSIINRFGASIYWAKESPSIEIEGLEFFTELNFCFLVEENFLIKNPLLKTKN
jgi:hypothetical protein